MIDELELAVTADERKDPLDLDGAAHDDERIAGMAGTAGGGHGQVRAA
jgi:hypothetical protein